MEKEDIKDSDIWSSPDDDDHSPANDYNDFTGDQTSDDRFDNAIINSNLVKVPEKKKDEVDLIKNPEKPKILQSLEEKPKRKTFSEQWEEVDEICPTCNKVSKPAEGLNRQNIKRLFSIQTDPQSLTILFLLIMCALFAFSTYTYMVNPVNCSNFTVMDAEIPEVYNNDIISYSEDSGHDYGDHTIIYTENYPEYVSLDNETIDLYNITE